MSAASLKVLKGQIDRGFATLATIDTWETKKTITAAEATEARAYWHQLNDPPPEPEPTPEPTPTPEPEPAAETPAPAPETPAADGDAPASS